MNAPLAAPARARELIRPQQWKYPPEAPFEKHPLNTEEEVAGEDFEEIVANMREKGFHSHRPIDVIGNQVVDGWTRYRAAQEAGVWFLVHELESGTDVAEFVCLANDLRRQKSAEKIFRRRRVRLLRAEGASLRAIAEAEGVSHATIQRDLEAPPDSAVTPITVGPPAIILGIDGREYHDKSDEEKAAAAARKKESAGKAKPGKAGGQLFDWKGFDGPFKALYNQADLVDAIARARGKLGKREESPGGDRLRRLLAEFRADFLDYFDAMTGGKAPRAAR